MSNYFQTDFDNLHQLACDGIIQMRVTEYPSFFNKIKLLLSGKKAWSYDGSSYPCYCISDIVDVSILDAVSLDVILCHSASFAVQNYASNRNIALCMVTNISNIADKDKVVLDINKHCITDVRGNVLANII